MTLGIRKTIVILGVIAIVLAANIWSVAQWLQDHGAVQWAERIREQFLTGTAITIVLVLLFLLTGPQNRKHER